MQKADSVFIYHYKEGKPSHIYRNDIPFATIYAYDESVVQAITNFLNQQQGKEYENNESLERQAAHKLHQDKIINPKTGEPY